MAVKGDPLEALARHGPSPVYAIDGDEPVLVDEAVALIKKHTLAPSARDFNLDTFSGRSTKLPRILDAAAMLPAFSSRRLVLVTQAEKLDLEDSDTLLRYLAQPNPTTVLVFVADRFDARTKLYKAFQRAGAVLRFDRPRARDLPDLLRRRAEAMGIGIDFPAIRALADAVGTDMSRAVQWLEVLSLYVGPSSGQKISLRDVEAVVSSTKEESIFALADAMGLGDKDAALRGLIGISDVAREPPLRTLAMVARHFRNLLKARAGLDAGMPRPDIQTHVGVPPFFMDGLLAQARRRSVEGLAECLLAIDVADRDLKGGALQGTRVLERLVLSLMRTAHP